MSLRRYSQRAMRERPGRTILTVLSIVIGVAAVVSVNTTTATTRLAYKDMFATILGRTSLEVRSAGAKQIPESLVEQMAAVPGVEAAVPLISLTNTVTVPRDDDQPIVNARAQVLGVDPLRDHLIRDFAIVAGKGLSESTAEINEETEFQVIIEAEFAKQLGIKPGSQVKLLTSRGRQRRAVEVVGLLRPKGANALTQAGIVCMPLRQMQYLWPNRDASAEKTISTVQIVALPDTDLKVLENTIAKSLPEGVLVQRPEGQSPQLLDELMKSTEIGLAQTTAFSLLLASFIILNTFLMNLSERRRHLAIMRAIGATRSQIIRMLLGESIVFGLVGTSIGIVVGLGFAYVLNNSMAKLLEVNLPALQVSWVPFALAVTFGMSMSILGAMVPALRAGRVSPLEGMSRVSKEDMGDVPRRYQVFGAIMVVISGALIGAGIAGLIPIEIPTYAAVALLMGLVLLVPLILRPFARLVAWAISPWVQIEGTMALRQVLRHQGRTALTVGVLFVAASTGLAMSSSILDNVNNLTNWYRRTINGDFYLRAMLPDMAKGDSASLPSAIEGELRAMPEIQYLDRGTITDLDLGDFVGKLLCREFHSPGLLPMDLVHGDPQSLREKMKQEEVVLASVLAKKMNVGLGDQIEIQTTLGKKNFKICGVTNDYLVAGMGVYMDWDVGHKYFEMKEIDGCVIWVHKGQAAKLEPKLQEIRERYGVLLMTAHQISRNIDKMVLGIDVSLWGLVILGFVVAAFGVVNTLTMNVLEQTRELGILRIVAMTKKQVRRTILTQALIIGGVGLIPGMLSGVIIAYIMNLAMEPNFGRKIDFEFHPYLVLFTLIGSLAITLLAAFFPAERAAKINVVDALHYE